MQNLNVATVSNNFYNLPLWIGIEKQFFERAEIKLNLIINESVDEVTQMIRTGEADIARGITEHVILDRENGGDLEVIAGSINKLPFSLIGNPKINFLEELKGKVIGASSLHAGSSSLIMQILADKGLLFERDYEILQVGPMKSRWELLQSHSIDCGLQGIPYNFFAIDSGYKEICIPSDYFPDFQFSSFNVSAEWAAENKTLIINFLEALLRSIRYMNSHREDSANIASSQMNIDIDYALRGWDECLKLGIMPSDGKASIPGIKTLIQVSGLIRAIMERTQTNPESYVNEVYINEAISRLDAKN